MKQFISYLGLQPPLGSDAENTAVSESCLHEYEPQAPLSFHLNSVTNNAVHREMSVLPLTFLQDSSCIKIIASASQTEKFRR